MATTEYKQSQDQCQTLIDEMASVCKGCGGVITPIETVDNAGDPTFWPHCANCEVFEYGVKKQVFEAARVLVDHEGRKSYHPTYKGEGPEYEKYYRQQNIRNACSEITAAIRGLSHSIGIDLYKALK